MPTYTTTGGRTLEYLASGAPLEAFLAKIMQVSQDDTVSVNDMTAMIYGCENPLLDATIVPGQYLVTADTFRNPIYHILLDQLTLKRIRLGEFDLADAHSEFTIDVATAAATLGMTLQGVRSAIESYRLAAIYKNGQWWTTESAIRGFTVSKAGRPKKERVSLGAESTTS